MKLMIIKADYNDGDYVHSINEISDEKAERFIEIVKKIKSVNPEMRCDERFNEDYSKYKDVISEDDYKIFTGFLPSAPDWDDVHTVDRITIYDINDKVNLV